MQGICLTRHQQLQRPGSLRMLLGECPQRPHFRPVTVALTLESRSKSGRSLRSDWASQLQLAVWERRHLSALLILQACGVPTCHANNSTVCSKGVGSSAVCIPELQLWMVGGWVGDMSEGPTAEVML